MSTPYQELLDAVHDLLNEIENSDYEDMVGSADRVNRLKKVSGFPSKVRVFGEPQGTLVDTKSPERFFDIRTYTGDNIAARKNFEETTEVLPPIGCISLKPGGSLLYKSAKKFFEVAVSYSKNVEAKVLHNLGCKPYVILGRSDSFGWFGWKADCIGQPVIIDSKAGGRQEFQYMPFKKVTEEELMLDASVFNGASYFYLFSKDGFSKVEDYINQENNI